MGSINKYGSICILFSFSRVDETINTTTTTVLTSPQVCIVQYGNIKIFLSKLFSLVGK